MTLYSEKCSTPEMPADGQQTAWPFDFRIDDTQPPESQLVVTDPTGLETVIDASLYSVSGYGLDDGGAITYPIGGGVPLASGYSTRVERAPAFLQPARLRNQGAYPPDTVEFGLDRTTKQTQYLRTVQERQEARLAAVEGVIDLLGPVPSFPVAPYLTAADLGLAGDGVTDDAPLLQAKADHYSALGGAVFFLTAPAGAFLFRDRVRFGSGLSVIFGSPQFFGKAGGLGIAGRMAVTPGRRTVLASAVAVGAVTLTLDTSLAGGAAVSALYPVGSQITVHGEFGSAGTAAWRQGLRVSAVNDGLRQVTVPATLYAFPAGSTVDLQATGYLLSDAAKDTSAVTLAAGRGAAFLAKDVVLAEDDKRAGDVAGASTARIRRQVLRVDGVVGDAVTFDRPLEIDLQTSRNARLTLLEEAADATVQGASAIFIEAPDAAPADPVPTFLIEYASGAFFYDAAVLNEDAYGSRGAGCMIRTAIDSAFVNPEVWNPKYTAADGDGDGVVIQHSSDCYIAQSYCYACRRSVVIAGAARPSVSQPISQGALSKDIHFAGWGERRARVVDPRIVGGGRAAGATRQAITFGDETVCGGTSLAYVEGGSVSHYSGVGLGHQALGIVIVPGTDGCEVKGLRLNDVEAAFQILDVPALPGLVALNPRVDIEIAKCSSYVAYINGHLRNPSAGYTIQGLELRIRARDVGLLLHVEKVGGCIVHRIDLDRITPNVSEPYVCRFLDVTGLVAEDGFVRGAARGFSLQTCPNFRLDGVSFHDLTLLEVLDDLGGNDGGWWGAMPCYGFEPTIGGTLTSVLGYARNPGLIAIADQTVRKFQPSRDKGTLAVTWGSSAGYLDARYKVGTSPGCTKVDASAATVVTTTGVLTGTTGTNGNITLSAHTDGILYLENRSGSSISVDLVIPA